MQSLHRLSFIPASLVLSLALLLPDPSLAAVPPPPETAASVATPDPTPQPEVDPTEQARQLYMDAEKLAAQERWAEAAGLYEQAYHLVPSKHGFAYKVGVAAYNGGDCDRADTYLRHLIEYGDPEKLGDKIDDAKRILGEIQVTGCLSTTPTTPAKTTQVIIDETPPELVGTRPGGEAGGGIDDPPPPTGPDRRLLIGGTALTVLGATGLGVALAGAGMSSSAAGRLRTLSSNATNSGFPVGDYSCRDTAASECPVNQEQRMRTGNVLMGVGFAAGGALVIGGVAMLVVHARRAKLETPSVALRGLGPTLLPGGAGASASLAF